MRPVTFSTQDMLTEPCRTHKLCAHITDMHRRSDGNVTGDWCIYHKNRRREEMCVCTLQREASWKEDKLRYIPLRRVDIFIFNYVFRKLFLHWQLLALVAWYAVSFSNVSQILVWLHTLPCNCPLTFCVQSWWRACNWLFSNLKTLQPPCVGFWNFGC